MTAAPILSGLSELADSYDVIFSDVWGVVHNGLQPHLAAGEALTRFRAGGGLVVMISNAPRPAWSVVAQLDQIGVVRSAYDAVVTSGDVTHRLALAESVPRCLHIGAEKDEPLFRDLAVERVRLEDAAFVICSGLADDETETAEDYRPLLERVRARNLRFICANPDLVVERGHRLIPCAGALAAIYEAMGGEVIQAGKPYPPIYAATAAKAESLLGRALDKRRVLAVGDAIRTDVVGASGFGVDCLFLSAGIHAGELHGAEGALDPARLLRFMEAQAAQPMATMRHLAW
ncbi:MAG: TIGR01459 family HAD-type hydrolase [Beijerinckiaceae bacterium]